MKNKIKAKKIEKVLEFLTEEMNWNNMMADRMIKRYPHLKGGLGDNITQPDYLNSSHINYHLGSYSGYRNAIEQFKKIIE